MSQVQPANADTIVKKNESSVTTAQKEKNRLKNKARKEKRKLANSAEKKDESTQKDTSGGRSSSKTSKQSKANQSLEKEQNNEISKNVANKSTNRNKDVAKKRKRSAKKKAPKVPERVTYKLTIRRLPPNLKENTFWDVVNTKFPEFKDAIHSHYYVEGYLPQTQYENPVFSRCYVDCIDEDSMMAVGRGIKTLTFTNDTEGSTEKEDGGNSEVFDEKMEVYIPLIEKSFYPKMPQGGVQPFSKNGSIAENPHYKLFAELLKEEGRMEMPKNIFEYAVELEERRKKEIKRQKRARAKAAKLEKLKRENGNKPVEKVANSNDKSLKKTKKKKVKKKAETNEKTKSSNPNEQKPIKFSLKKKPVVN